MWFEKEHAKKKTLASDLKNLRREFSEYTNGMRINNNNNNNNNSSNSNVNIRIPTNTNIKAMRKLSKTMQKTAEKHHDTNNMLRSISNKLGSRKMYSHERYSHVRNKMIPRTKAKIRAQNSTRAFEQVRSKLANKLPMNLVSKILTNNVFPSGLVRTGKKVKTYWGGTTTNLSMYTNKNGRFWFQDKKGRWYLMSSPTQVWHENNHGVWRPYNL